jgi:ELWxxDGT repeat protein
MHPKKKNVSGRSISRFHRDCRPGVSGVSGVSGECGAMFQDLEPRRMLSFTTELVADLNPTGLSFAAGLTVVGDHAFFRADNGTNGTELWITDGTTAGTTMVKDIRTTPSVSSSASPNNLTPFNGQLYFDANDGVHGFEMWRSDGTAQGTSLFIDMNPNAGNGFTALNESIVIGSTLFFSGNDGTHGVELFKTDGTVPGTQLVKDILPGSLSSQPSSLTDVNGTLFFIADDSDSDFNRELWMSDGTAGNTVKIKEINPNGSAIDQHAAMTALDGVIYFAADDGVHGFEPWRSDGTADGTFMIQDVNPGAGSSLFSGNQSFYQYFVPYNGNIYFQADDGAHGRELWKTNGTQGNASLLVDLNTAGDAFPLTFTHHNIVANNLLFFSAVGDGVGAELFVTDGTAEGTAVVEDLEPGPGAVAGPGFFLAVLQDSGAPLIFMNALTTATGYEPFVLDTGVLPYNIELVDDVSPGANSSNPVSFTLLPASTSSLAAKLSALLPDISELLFLADTGNADTGLFKINEAAAPELINISGVKYNDRSGDGEYDSDEDLPVANVVVFIDLNGNGVPDIDLATGLPEPTTATDSNGVFMFYNRPPDDRSRVKEVLSAGTIQTDASFVFDSIRFLNFKTITVSGTKTYTTFGTGNNSDHPHVTVYNDVNKNHVLDPGEVSTQTDDDGHYSISGLGPGEVRIEEVVPAGYDGSTPLAFDAESGVNKTGKDIENTQLVYTADSKTPFVQDNGIFKVSISGPGTVTITYDIGGGVESVNVEGSTLSSKLTIDNGGTPKPIGSLNSTSPIGIVNASDADFQSVNVLGDLKSALIGAFKDEHLFNIGGEGATSKSAVTLVFREVANADIVSAIPIKSLTVIDWQDTDEDPDTITAPFIGSVTTKGDTANALAGDFEAGFILSGVGVAAGKPALNSANIKGSLTGNSNITGGVGALKVGGNFGGAFTARAIKSFSVGGSVIDANITLTQGVDPKLRALGALTVKGDVLRTTLRAAGNISKATLGSLLDSTLFAGVKVAVTGLPATLTDFDAPTAGISSLSIKGNPASPTADAFANSLVAAGVLGKVVLIRVDTTNDEPFGFAADKFGAISGLHQAIAKLDTPQEIVDGDLVVRVL